MHGAFEKLSAKERNHNDWYTDRVANMLAGLIRRRRVAEVVYDDADQGYIPSFPYYKLWTKLAERLDEGVRLVSMKTSREVGAKKKADAGLLEQLATFELVIGEIRRKESDDGRSDEKAE